MLSLFHIFHIFLYFPCLWIFMNITHFFHYIFLLYSCSRFFKWATCWKHESWSRIIDALFSYRSLLDLCGQVLVSWFIGIEMCIRIIVCGEHLWNCFTWWVSGLYYDFFWHKGILGNLSYLWESMKLAHALKDVFVNAWQVCNPWIHWFLAIEVLEIRLEVVEEIQWYSRM